MFVAAKDLPLTKNNFIDMKVNFNLRKVGKPAEKLPPQIIYIIVRFDNKKVAYPTPFKVSPKNWDLKRQRVRNVIDEPKRDVINGYLNDVENAISIFYAQSVENRELITPESVKAYLDKYTKPTAKPLIETPLIPSFIGFVNQFIEDSPNRTNTQTNTLLSKKTIQKYVATQKHLERFEKDVFKKKLMFENIDLSFHSRFTAYLQAKQFKPNTIGKYIAIVKCFLNEAALQGFTVNREYKSKHFKVQKEDVENIYLSEKELKTLLAFDLSDKPRLEKIRDLFLVGCWTGLRFSDWSNLKPENIKGDLIVLETVKTKTPLKIPLHPVVIQILERHKGILPQCPKEQNVNDYLKELGKMVGFTESIERYETRGGKRDAFIYEKWELITTHTARRSFATNAYKMGMPSLMIRAITTHKTEAAFMKYIKVTNEENADMMRKFWEKVEQNPSEQLRKVG